MAHMLKAAFCHLYVRRACFLQRKIWVVACLLKTDICSSVSSSSVARLLRSATRPAA